MMLNPFARQAPALSTRILRGAAPALMMMALAGCASTAQRDISLIPAQTDAVSSKDGVFVQPVKWTHHKPDCRGECPTLAVDSLVFPGIARLTELIDHALAMMTGMGEDGQPPYATIAEFEDYFWTTAAPRDEVHLTARTRYRNRHLTVIELNSEQYFTGAAHGMTATQFLNWDNAAQRVLGLDHVIQPGARDRYVQALAKAHQAWVAQRPEAREDVAAWERLWPFQPSDNFALTDAGLVVKYDSYEIAPYSSGQPELLIPYSELQAVLKPEYLPGDGENG